MKNICLYIRRKPQTFFDDVICIQRAIRLQSGWDATFTLPYIEFRRRLSEIAMSGYMKLRVSCICNYDDVPLLNKFKNDDNYVILPIDDDDWLCPALIPILRQLDYTGCHCVTWNTLRYLHRQNDIVTITNQNNKPSILSCAYAITHQIPHMIGHSNVVMNHLAISSLFDKGEYLYHHLDEVYAWSNKLLSSLHLSYYFREKRDRTIEEMKSMMTQCVKHKLTHDRDDVPDWARSQWKQLVDLLNDLLLTLKE